MSNNFHHQMEMYLYRHTIIRNDEKCPECRVHKISLHTDLKRALMMAPLQIDRNILMREWSIWTGEEEFGKDGDLYHLFRIIPGKTYNLLSSDVTVEKIGDKPIQGDFEARYLFVRIEIDPREYCADNRIFRISFYQTKKDALKEVHSWTAEGGQWYSEEEKLLCLLKDKDVEKVMKYEPIRIQGYGSKRVHYQLIHMNIGETLDLGELCRDCSWKDH